MVVTYWALKMQAIARRGLGTHFASRCPAFHLRGSRHSTAPRPCLPENFQSTEPGVVLFGSRGFSSAPQSGKRSSAPGQGAASLTKESGIPRVALLAAATLAAGAAGAYFWWEWEKAKVTPGLVLPDEFMKPEAAPRQQTPSTNGVEELGASSPATEQSSEQESRSTAGESSRGKEIALTIGETKQELPFSFDLASELLRFVEGASEVLSGKQEQQVGSELDDKSEKVTAVQHSVPSPVTVAENAERLSEGAVADVVKDVGAPAASLVPPSAQSAPESHLQQQPAEGSAVAPQREAAASDDDDEPLDRVVAEEQEVRAASQQEIEEGGRGDRMAQQGEAGTELPAVGGAEREDAASVGAVAASSMTGGRDGSPGREEVLELLAAVALSTTKQLHWEHEKKLQAARAELQAEHEGAVRALTTLMDENCKRLSAKATEAELKLQQQAAEHEGRLWRDKVDHERELEAALRKKEADVMLQAAEVKTRAEVAAQAELALGFSKFLVEASSLEDRVSALREAFFAQSEETRKSHGAHKLALCAFLLQSALSSGTPLADLPELLRGAMAPGPEDSPGAQPDALVAAVAESIPTSVVRLGAPTRQQLLRRLSEIRPSLLQLAILPADASPGPLAFVAARAATAFKVAEAGSSLDGGGAEAALGRAESLLLEGRLVEAAEALQAGCEGSQGGALARQWADEVLARAVAEQALVTLQSHATAIASTLA